MREHNSTLGNKDPSLENRAVLYASTDQEQPPHYLFTLLYYSIFPSSGFSVPSSLDTVHCSQAFVIARALFERQHLPVLCILHILVFIPASAGVYDHTRPSRHIPAVVPFESTKQML